LTVLLVDVKLAAHIPLLVY